MQHKPFAQNITINTILITTEHESSSLEYCILPLPLRTQNNLIGTCTATQTINNHTHTHARHFKNKLFKCVSDLFQFKLGRKIKKYQLPSTVDDAILKLLQFQCHQHLCNTHESTTMHIIIMFHLLCLLLLSALYIKVLTDRYILTDK